MGQKLRHFIYADVETINSIFGQLYPNVADITVSDEKSFSSKLNAEVGLPSILQGFLKGNFSGECGRDAGHGVSVDVKISIEHKIELISLCADGEEVEEIQLPKSSNETLILGTGIAVPQKTFDDIVTPYLHSKAYETLDNYFKDFVRGVNTSLWRQIVSICLNEYCSAPFVAPFLIGMSGGGLDENGVDRIRHYYILDFNYPIYMPFSCNKILMSASTMASLGFIRRISQFTVLGILNKIAARMYTIKPLAIWTIMDYSDYTRRHKFQIENFTNYWK